MAAEGGIFPVINKQLQDVEKHQSMAALMDLLRARNPQHRTWLANKLGKTPNMAEKRTTEQVDKPQLQKCLDTLQKAIKVCNYQTLLERLEAIARQVGLTFTVNNDFQLFISSDMFYIDIHVDKGGGVKDVKIVHQGDPLTCEELKEILQNGRFDEFVTHLEGLQKIYQLNGDKKIKTKGFLALQSIEKDLNTLAQLQSSIINGVAKYIHKSPLGILLPRKGGLPMELMYFVSPYDLLDKLTKTAHPLTLEAITEFNLGQRLTVSMEPGAPKNLQTMPLMTVTKTPEGKSLPSFTNISNVNSHLLPACFTLNLKQPIPVALSVVQKIQSVTGLDLGQGMSEDKPLLDLLIHKYSSGGLTKDTKQLIVSLPDQQHVYFVNGVNGGSLDQPGVEISAIPFIHPTSVPKILNYLRQQLLFNSVISSVIRPSSQNVGASSVVCELTTISMQQLSVTFEHPAHDDMVTVEMDLGDITSLKCRVATTCEQVLCSDDFASKIFQRCMSVPITVRSVLKKGKDMLEKATVEAVKAVEALRPPVVKPRPPPPAPHFIPPPSQQFPPAVAPSNHQVEGFPQPPPYPSENRSSSHEMVSPPIEKATPLLANLLDQDGDQSQGNTDSTDSPMLSRLLEEQSGVSNISLMNPGAPPPKRKYRKRKSASEVFSGPSPKHRMSDMSGGYERLESFEMDNSSSPFDGGGGGTGGGGGGTTSSFSASRSLGSVIDLTEDAFGAESNLKKLAESVDSLIPREMNRQPESELTALLVENDLNNHSIGMSRNSSQIPKNEKASISLEGLLTAEAGDNYEADDPILATSLTSPLITTKLERPEQFNSTLDANLRNEIFGSDDEKSKNVKQLLTHRVPSQDLMDSKFYGKNSAKTNSDLSATQEKKEITGIFEKLENLKGEQLPGKKESEQTETGNGSKVMKLKLSTSGLRGGEGRVFDFPSDESEDDSPSLGSYSSSSERLSVYSQSPTRLQISNKTKSSHDSLLKKSDKYKRKEAKYNSKSESTKRKKLKDESKKEKKKRKLNDVNQYVQPIKETVYRSVESDQRSVTKLKIRVGKEPQVVNPVSPNKETEKKFVVSRQDSSDSTKERHLQKTLHKSKSYLNSQSSSEGGKTDPKLAKATIRLKPLHIPNSGSSVTVNPGQKSSGKLSAEIKAAKSGNQKLLNSGMRNASPSISASGKSSMSASINRTSSPSIRTSSSPNLSGGKTSPSVSVSGKSAVSPNLSATGRISSPSLSGVSKNNSPILSKTSSPISSASSKSSSPSLSGLNKSGMKSSLSKSGGTVSAKSSSGLSSKSGLLSSSKSSSSLNTGRGSNMSKGLAKASSTSSLGTQPTSMSMSAYLPNAPSASKVARLPPIPKLSSSQSSSQASNISHSSALHSPPSQPPSSNSSSQDNSSKNKPNMPPVARARKGSLSAVIDKLTKATGSTNTATDNSDVLSKPTFNDGQVSRDPRMCNPKNEKLGDRGSSVVSDKSKGDSMDRKPSRPESINFANKPRNPEGSNYKIQKSPSTNKPFKSDFSNMNKKLMNSSENAVPGKSRGHSDSSGPPLNSILKTPNLNSPNTTKPVGILKNAHHVSPIFDESPKQKIEVPKRSQTPTQNTGLEDPRTSQFNQVNSNNSANSVSRSVPERTKEPTRTVGPLETALDLSVSDKNMSPKVTQQGPQVGGASAKLNGEVSKEEKEPFKVPTPKPQTPEVKDLDVAESPKRKVVTPVKNIASPRSDASSPDNSLIIDCTASPAANKTEDEQTTKSVSDSYSQSDMSKDSGKSTPTSVKSGSKDVTPPNTSSTSPERTNSPCDIDDDLMDQALLGLNS